MTLFQGQAMDIFWTYNRICPDLDQYFRMTNHSELPRARDRAWAAH